MDARSVHPAGISIHALREEGDAGKRIGPPRASPISIHALREEGDSGRTCRVQEIEISIHALREEGD